MSIRFEYSLAIVIISIVAILVIIGIAVGISDYQKVEIVDCTEILDKERVYDRDQSYYLIFTEDGTFTIQDDLFEGNFSSSDWYGSLKEGEKYRLYVRGVRRPYLSQYPNVYKKPVKCN